MTFKKWLIIILGLAVIVAGNWLSKNPWVFEKRIAVEYYEEFLTGTSWRYNNDSITIISKYQNEGVYLRLCTAKCISPDSYGTWEIENNIIKVSYWDSYQEKQVDFESKIYKLTKQSMVTKLNLKKTFSNFFKIFLIEERV